MLAWATVAWLKSLEHRSLTAGPNLYMMRGGTEHTLALVMSFTRVTALGPTTSWHEVDVGSVTPEATGDAVPVTYNGQLLVYGGQTLDSGQ